MSFMDMTPRVTTSYDDARAALERCCQRARPYSACAKWTYKWIKSQARKFKELG